MSWKILINDGMESAGVQQLIAAGFDITTDKIAQEELAEKLDYFDGIIVRSATKLRKELIDVCPNLKFIARGGVGMDNIDVNYAREKGIRVINTPAASSRSVAELAMAHLLAITRNLQDANRQLLNSNTFQNLKKEYSASTEIYEKTLLLIGFGRIGKELAKMALGAEMKVIVCDPFLKSADLEFNVMNHRFQVNLELVSLEQGLAEADYISLHSPYTGKALIGKNEFEKIKKGVFIINTSRGENIDEDSLLEAIASKKVKAVGLDVYQNEPDILSSLLQNKSISTTPHIGASTQEAQARIALELVSSIKKAFAEWQTN